MGIKIGTNFEYSSENFLDARSSCESLDALIENRDEVLYPRGFEVYCRKENQWYINVGCETCDDCPTWEIRGLHNIDFDEFATKEYVQGSIDAIEIPSIDGLATEEFVKKQIKSIPEPDLKDYATKEHVTGQIEYSLKEMASERYVQEQIDAIELPDLEPYATREYVKYTVDNMAVTHLSGYATKEYVKAKLEDIEIPEVDLSGFATKEYIEGQIAPLASEKYVERKLEKYVTKETVEEQLETSFGDLVKDYATKEYVQGEVDLMLSDEDARRFYATKEYVTGAIDGIEIPDVDGLATEEFVKNEIAKAQLDGGDVDLSGFASKTELKSGLALKSDIGHAHSFNDLSDKPVIPSIEGLATEEYVRQQIEAIEIPEIDFSGLATKVELEEVRGQIPSIEGLASEDFVREQVAGIEIPEVNLDGLATEDFVREQIEAIPEVDLSEYATKVELNDKAQADHFHENFVEKEEGKSLVADSEIARLAMLKNYDDTEIREMLAKIMLLVDTRPEYVQPSLVLEVSKESVESGKDEEVIITPNFVQGDAGEVTRFVILRDGVQVHESISIEPFKEVLNIEEKVTYTARVEYAQGAVKNTALGIPDEERRIPAGHIEDSKDVEILVITSLIFYGKVPYEVTQIDASHVPSLTQKVAASREFVLDLKDLDDERPVYMYPTSFGLATSIKDGNGFDCSNGTFNINTLTYDGIEYYVYIIAESIFGDAYVIFS